MYDGVTMYGVTGWHNVWVEDLMAYWYDGFRGAYLPDHYDIGCFEEWANLAGYRTRERALADEPLYGLEV